MRSGPAKFETFLKRVHRRSVVMRVADRAGLGVLGGCAAALPLVGCLLWRQMPTAGVALAGPLIGGAAGALWGILTRPIVMLAALEADRQLGWDDLLSSAVSIHPRESQNPWAAAVRSLADARCSGVSHTTIMLNRLGARAWGGIGLATALILALGLIPTFAAPTRADNPPELSRNALAALAGEPAPSHALGGVPHRNASQAEPEDASTSAEGLPRSDSIHDSNPEPADDRTAPRDSSSHNISGTGRGASQSNTVTTPKPLAPTFGGPRAEAPTSGRGTGGSGQTSAGPPGTADPSGQTTGGSNHPAKSAPPWQSSTRSADLQRANTALRSGRIPDAYHDIIRDYFQEP